MLNCCNQNQSKFPTNFHCQFYISIIHYFEVVLTKALFNRVINSHRTIKCAFFRSLFATLKFANCHLTLISFSFSSTVKLEVYFTLYKLNTYLIIIPNGITNFFDHLFVIIFKFIYFEYVKWRKYIFTPIRQLNNILLLFSRCKSYIFIGKINGNILS